MEKHQFVCSDCPGDRLCIREGNNGTLVAEIKWKETVDANERKRSNTVILTLAQQKYLRDLLTKNIQAKESDQYRGEGDLPEDSTWVVVRP